MSQAAKQDAQSETPVNPYSLLEAVNASSDTVNTGWLIFLGLMAYVLIAVAGVTHKDFLLETPVALPIMQVSIQLKQFFMFAPLILVLFHLGVVAQLVLLARKTIEFDRAVRLLELSDRRTHPLRLELHNFFFVQAIAGPHRSRVMSAFLHGMSWLTTVIIPVVLLLYIQVAFLPYHDIAATWVHRIALMIDLGVLLLIGTFLLRTETTFFGALASNTRAHPFNVAFTSMLLLFLGFVSFFVATIPDEYLDRQAQAWFGAPKATPSRDRANIAAAPVSLVTAGVDGALFGVFRRNLVVTDADLVADKGVSPDETTINLRGRDLRYARLDRSDLHQADFTGADLSEASLIGTNLRSVRLNCGDLSEFILTEDRAAARCSTAMGATFARADLQGARLSGADLRSAIFDHAGLEATDLSYAVLSGASFVSARLDTADMTGGIRVEGANFLLASLQGVDLTGAELSGADFSSANLQGALLSFARLNSALLRDADLEGASLHRAKLFGADLSRARMTAADVRGASVWLASPPFADPLALADWAAIEITRPRKDEIAAIKALLARLQGERVLPRVKAKLEPLMAEKSIEAWSNSAANEQWRALISAPATAEPSDATRARLTDHLSQMMCRTRAANAGVATGVVRRAQAQQFTGNVTALYERAKRDDCPSAGSVSEKAMRGLASAVETAKVN
ncbi:MAG: pentapeptide repeat-containing protein [Hyphomicrobium sp.]